MRFTAQVLTLSIVLLSAGRVSAQVTATGNNSRISVEGCVERAQRNGSVAGTGVGTSAPPNVADREANSSEILEVFMLTDAQPVADNRSPATERTSYALVGQGREFSGHTGHRVQIVGTLAPPVSSGASEGSRAAAGIRRIQVESVKMVAASCSGNKPK
jgi:hypothetical protein